MLRPKSPPRITALDYALWLLARRDYFRAEIRTKLVDRGYLLQAADEAVRRLGEMNLIHDDELLRRRIEALVFKPEGRAKLRFALGRKGVSPDLFDAVWSELQPDERALARVAGEKKLRAVREADPRRRRDKLARFLASRGFAPDVVFSVAAELVRDSGLHDDES